MSQYGLKHRIKMRNSHEANKRTKSVMKMNSKQRNDRFLSEQNSIHIPKIGEKRQDMVNGTNMMLLNQTSAKCTKFFSNAPSNEHLMNQLKKQQKLENRKMRKNVMSLYTTSNEKTPVNPKAQILLDRASKRSKSELRNANMTMNGRDFTSLQKLNQTS